MPKRKTRRHYIFYWASTKFLGDRHLVALPRGHNYRQDPGYNRNTNRCKRARRARD